MKQGTLPNFTFQPLTYIRQIGTHESADGGVTYTFLAQVSSHLPLVVVALTMTATDEVRAYAYFDETRKESELQQTDLSTWDFTDPCDGCGGRIPIAQASYFEDHEEDWVALCPTCKSNLIADILRTKRAYQQARCTLIAYARAYWIGKWVDVERTSRTGFQLVTSPITRIMPSGRVYLARLSHPVDIEEIIFRKE